MKTKIKVTLTAIARQTHWDNLRSKIASRLVQSTIVVPVIGYVILFSAELQDFLRLVFEPVATTPNISPRLFWLYFGFCALAIATLVFNWRCPRLVKIHGASFRFVENELRIMNVSRIERFEFAIASAVGRGPRQINFEDKNTQIEIMTNFFEYLEESDSIFRWVVFVFYWTGAVLVAIPTVLTFTQVSRAAWQAAVGG